MEALLLTQQIRSVGFADALLAAEQGKKQEVLNSVREYQPQWNVTAMIDRLGGHH
ncbi:hypothetical protein AB5I41_04255 [Sphingomonas sp. MMS24-JH45]